MLFTHWERRYPYLSCAVPLAEEGLLVPFYVGGKAVGTIWAIMDSDRRQFDSEDNRVMASLGKFASSAYQAVQSTEDLKFQIAERERAEKELRELTNELEMQVRPRTEELERRNKQLADLAHISRVTTMGELTASLAHEIKQPISAAATDARTCLRWLAANHPDVADAQEAASRIVKDVTRASDIINRIGSLFKKEIRKRELSDINEVIQEMIALLSSEAARYSISIHADLANDLPRVTADRIQLQQVFMNLMLNAFEAMKGITPPGRVTIKSRQEEARAIQPKCKSNRPTASQRCRARSQPTQQRSVKLLPVSAYLRAERTGASQSLRARFALSDLRTELMLGKLRTYWCGRCRRIAERAPAESRREGPGKYLEAFHQPFRKEFIRFRYTHHSFVSILRRSDEHRKG